MHLIHKYPVWSPPEEATTVTLKQDGILVYRITNKRVTQTRSCQVCGKAQLRVVDNHEVDKEVQGKFYRGSD